MRSVLAQAVAASHQTSSLHCMGTPTLGKCTLTISSVSSVAAVESGARPSIPWVGSRRACSCTASRAPDCGSARSRPGSGSGFAGRLSRAAQLHNLDAAVCHEQPVDQPERWPAVHVGRDVNHASAQTRQGQPSWTDFVELEVDDPQELVA